MQNELTFENFKDFLMSLSEEQTRQLASIVQQKLADACSNKLVFLEGEYYVVSDGELKIISKCVHVNLEEKEVLFMDVALLEGDVRKFTAENWWHSCDTLDQYQFRPLTLQEKIRFNLLKKQGGA